MINSNLGPILHRLVTIHPRQTNRQTDDRRHRRAIDALQHNCSASKSKALIIQQLVCVHNFIKCLPIFVILSVTHITSKLEIGPTVTIVFYERIQTGWAKKLDLF